MPTELYIAALVVAAIALLALLLRGRKAPQAISAGEADAGPALRSRATEAEAEAPSGEASEPAAGEGEEIAVSDPSASTEGEGDWEEDDDITLVTVKFDIDMLRGQGVEVPESAPGARADEDDDYLDMKVEEIDEDLEPAARAHALVADEGAEVDDPTLTTEAFLVSAARQTHVGQRRKRNEDCFLLMHDLGVYVVADGMGGYAGGDVASRLAVETIARAFREESFDAKVHAELPRRATELAQAMQAANLAVWELSTDDPELRGMGTTLVGARFALKKRRVYIGHIGDSRCYRLRNGKLRQLTMDHTLGSYGVTGPRAHRLVRAVGIGSEVEIDVITGEPKIGDIYLFCSDGLNKMVSDEEIQQILLETPDLDSATQRLVDRANERGGRDNITVVLVGVRPPPRLGS